MTGSEEKMAESKRGCLGDIISEKEVIEWENWCGKYNEDMTFLEWSYLKEKGHLNDYLRWRKGKNVR